MEESEQHKQIGHALRSAAGLPYEEDPFVLRPDEAHLHDLETFVLILVYTSEESAIEEPPGKVAKELAAIRRHLRKLRTRFAGLDDGTVRRLQYCLELEIEEGVMSCDWQRLNAETLSYLEKLESAVAKVEELAKDEAKRPPISGPRKSREVNVAHYVARYIKEATGAPPKLSWRGSEPTCPYGRALCDIFVLLGLSPGSFQRAGTRALGFLKPNP